MSPKNVTVPFTTSGAPNGTTTTRDLTDIQDHKNISSTLNHLLKMKKNENYEIQVRDAVEATLPHEEFRLVESLYEQIIKMDKNAIWKASGSLINALFEGKEPTEDPSDDTAIDLLQVAIPELIENNFLTAIATIEKPVSPIPKGEGLEKESLLQLLPEETREAAGKYLDNITLAQSNIDGAETLSDAENFMRDKKEFDTLFVNFLQESLTQRDFSILQQGLEKRNNSTQNAETLTLSQ